MMPHVPDHWVNVSHHRQVTLDAQVLFSIAAETQWAAVLRACTPARKTTTRLR